MELWGGELMGCLGLRWNGPKKAMGVNLTLMKNGKNPLLSRENPAEGWLLYL